MTDAIPEQAGLPAWTVHQARTVYDGAPWVRVDLADVAAPDGTRFEHHVIRMPRVAIAVVVDEATDTVLMLHRERWVIGQWGYELLGGLVEDGEDPADAAAREALEESGWQPRGPSEHLLTIHPLPGIVDTAMDCYLWRHGADRVTNPSDPYEVGTLSWMPLARVPGLAAQGQLLGAGTATAVLYYIATGPGRSDTT
ncbi:MAG TPA: NUDIX hydrolase [Pseudonocardiaceae bacterium]|nr:NUDIX hydrolase [Pseudonocardiaceae bacterium]